MTKHTFAYEHLCDLLYTVEPADFKAELDRLKLRAPKLRALLKRHARELRQRLEEIEVETKELAADKKQAEAHLAAVIKFLT